MEEVDTIKEVASELEAIVDHIQTVTQALQIPALPQPWLPPLAERLYVETLDQGRQPLSDVTFTFGLADLPHEQKQEAVSVNLTTEGNVALYGAPGTGKTTFLQTAIMSLARHYRPDQVQFYLLDFGTNGLAPLSQLPHVADWLLLDQEEKVSKFTRIMTKELARRKKLLSQHGVGSMKLYQEVTGQREPTLVVVLDSFEGIKDASFETELQQLLVRLTREGLSVGVHLIVTAGRQLSLRATLHSNIKVQMSLPQNDYSDVTTAVGSTPLARHMDNIKGRILMKRDQVDVVQIALPVEAESDVQMIDKLRTEALQLKEDWTGEVPSAIPMVPEELTEEYFFSLPSVQEAIKKGEIPLGLDLENVEALSWNGRDNLLYLAEKEKNMEEIIHLLSYSSKKLIVLAPDDRGLRTDELHFLYDINEVASMIGAIYQRIEERLLEKVNRFDTVVVLYDWENLVEILNQETRDELHFIIKKGSKVGYPVFVSASPHLSRKIDAVSKDIRGFKMGVIDVRLNDQTIFNPIGKPYREPVLKDQEHYLVTNEGFTIIKIPFVKLRSRNVKSR